MELLFLGLMFDENEYKNIKQKTLNNLDLPIAANVFQQNLINGLKENGVNIIGLNSLPVGTWPKQYKDLYISEYTGKTNGIECYNTKTLNFVGLKQISRYISSYKFLKKYIRENENTVILTYNFYLPYYMALTKLKKEGYKFHICTLVTDLPNEFGIVTEKGIRKILADLIGKRTMNMTRHSDSFVLLTDQMKYPLKVGNRPYVVVEGFSSSNLENIKADKDVNVKTVVYTGTMNRKFGVENLIKAFLMVNCSNVELHLYGIGDMSDEIKLLAKKHKNIIYHGSVYRDEVLIAQKNATLLVNPRANDEEYTKYSFPSKTMEYLVSGRPVLAFLLDGMPEEYKDYIIAFNENTPEAIARIIENMLQKDSKELDDIGNKSKNFALKFKNCRVQTKKIVDSIDQM